MVYLKQMMLAMLASLMLVFITSSLNAEHIIYLVRHAEKEKGSNPSLTQGGVKRAAALAEFLQNKNITTVFSTDYKRTIETATPTAKQAGVEISIYDPRNLSLMKEKLSLQEGATLVVGHSNTTPRLFNLLTGLHHADLDEHRYDHVYIVTVDVEGKASHTIHYLEPRTP
jgi:broad specificity phosphatase PhoE